MQLHAQEGEPDQRTFERAQHFLLEALAQRQQPLLPIRQGAAKFHGEVERQAYALVTTVCFEGSTFYYRVFTVLRASDSL